MTDPSQFLPYSESRCAALLGRWSKQLVHSELCFAPVPFVWYGDPLKRASTHDSCFVDKEAGMYCCGGLSFMSGGSLENWFPALKGHVP